MPEIPLTQEETLARDPETGCPVVDSVGAMDVALTMLRNVQGLIDEAAAERDEAIQAAGQEYEEAVTSGHDGDSPLHLPTFAEQLETAIGDYARNHPEDVFPDGKKTVHRPAGDVSLRRKPASVTFKARADRASVLKSLTDGVDLAASIDRLLKRLKLTGRVKLKPELDLKAIQTDHANGRLDELPDGLKAVPATESVTIKPATRPID